MTFQPDIPGAIVVEAHPNNVRPGVNHPKVLVLHTPEEAADATEVTPQYFAKDLLQETPPRRASTHYYASGGAGTLGDGDLYQMVPEHKGAIANGVLRKPYPAGTDPGTSLNLQSLSIEIEGYAGNMHKSMPHGSQQWTTVVVWIVSRAEAHGIPIDRDHVIGHREVSAQRSDPGTLDLNLIVADAQALAAHEEEDEMLWLVKEKGSSATFITNGVVRAYVADRAKLQELQNEGIWPTKVKVVPKDSLSVIPRVDTL